MLARVVVLGILARVVALVILARRAMAGWV
jgi:hypothetical protein